MLTRRMATQIEKKITRVLMRGLVIDPTGRRRISWFDLTDAEWELLKAYIEDIITEEEASRDCATLTELFTKWKHGMTGANNAKKLEIDAAALEAIPDLPTDLGGLKAWYNFARGQGDPDWGDVRPPEAEMRWGEKLVKIVRAAEEALGVIYARWNDATQIITHYNEFRRLKGTYGTDLTRLRIETEEVTIEEVRDGIGNANREVTQWLDGLNNFYRWAPEPRLVDHVKMYFAGQGFNKTTIDWTVFKNLMDTNRGKVANNGPPKRGRGQDTG